MVHPFDLRDIPLVTRLENSGVPLCNEAVLTHGLSPLRSALIGYLSPRKYKTYTCVVSGAAREGFAQMRPRPASGHGAITYIAPSLASGGGATAWQYLLEAIAAAAGEIGLQQLIAEARPEGPEVEALRQAGFAVYLRQDILRLERRAAQVGTSAAAASLRQAAPVDTWAIQQLYANTVPRLAQLAEPIPRVRPSSAARGYVLEENGEMAAYLEIRRGPAGAWFSVMVHPQAEMHAQRVLAHGLALLGEAWSKPVYCCVRRYQEWLREPLLDLGFETFAASAALVKRLAVPAELERAPLKAIEPRPITASVTRAVD